jgi:hypothetical protein
MTRVFIVNELNIWGMLLNVLLGNIVYVYKTNALIKPLTPLLQLIVDLMMKTARVKNVQALDPGSIWIGGLPVEALYSDHYPRTQRLLEKHFDIASRYSPDNEYVYPSLKVSDSYQHHLISSIHLTDWLANILPARSWHINGLNACYPTIHAMVHGTMPNFSHRLVSGKMLIANGFSFLIFYLFAVGWLATRVRWAINRETHFLAVDSWAQYDKDLFSKIVDKPDEILICQRDRSHAIRDRGEYLRNRKCVKEDGLLRPRQAFSLLRTLSRDSLSIWRTWNKEDAMMFSWLISLPLKRAKYTVFFNRFSVRFFWGRDDYSVEHILRSQELRKSGGTSIGINHGLTHKCFDAAWKHIDFDIYYTFGRHLYETYYRKYWASGIVVRPIGSTRVGSLPTKDERPGYIVYFVNPRFEATFFMSEVFKVARHFPDRRILVKIKPWRVRDDYCRPEREMLAFSPPNVEETLADSYGLMDVACYAISTGSTIIAESLQRRMKTFVLDGRMNGEYFYYRDFPGLCVQSGEDIIGRIEDIESGRETYDPEIYSSLIDMSGANIANIIRKDMGLPPSEPEAGIY